MYLRVKSIHVSIDCMLLFFSAALTDQTYLLEYCEALMSTVPAYKINPNEYMSHESVLCALNLNRLDLLAHWIAQDRSV